MNRPQTRAEIVQRNYADGKNRMIRKLFALGYGMNFDLAKTIEERQLSRSDRCKKHLDQWFTEDPHSPVKKAVDKMTYKELTTAITVMEKLRKNYLSKI